MSRDYNWPEITAWHILLVAIETELLYGATGISFAHPLHCTATLEINFRIILSKTGRELDLVI